MNKSLKWSPALPIRKQDNIISSKAREENEQGFIPSYYSAKTEDMWHIMSNEYMRIWFKERGVYEKNTYARDQIIREESKIKRRYVQRMMTYKRPTKNQWIDEKNRSKSKSSEPLSVDYEKIKYKPSCLLQKPITSPKKLQELTKLANGNESVNDNNCRIIEGELEYGSRCDNN